MAPEAVEAMREAAQWSVALEELQEKAGAYLTEVTGSEAGYVTCGAAAGLQLAAAACLAGLDIRKMNQLPDTTTMPNEIVVQRCHRNAYDHALRSAGAKLVEVGQLGSPTGSYVASWNIEAAIHSQTVAVHWVDMAVQGAVSLEDTVAVAHRHRLPVIVDAAAALPPVENLRRFVAAGADLVAFSGGKAIPDSGFPKLFLSISPAVCGIFFDTMHLKIISKSSLGILSAASSLKNSIICSGFNSVTSSPCLSKFVILEQSIEATKFDAGWPVLTDFLILHIFSNISIYSESKICSDN